MKVTIGTAERTITLTPRPTTLADAATRLQSVMTQGPGGVDFTQALVAVLGSQLLIVPGGAGPANFEGVSSGDQTTVAELLLRARYPVRVRVNGAETIDHESLEMPT
jgi:hypothetical protein